MRRPLCAFCLSALGVLVLCSFLPQMGLLLPSARDGERHFNENYYTRVATAHAVGDLEGFVSTGVHAAFLPELTGYNVLNGTYNQSGKGNDMQLTLDSDLCVTARVELNSSLYCFTSAMRR